GWRAGRGAAVCRRGGTHRPGGLPELPPAGAHAGAALRRVRRGRAPFPDGPRDAARRRRAALPPRALLQEGGPAEARPGPPAGRADRQPSARRRPPGAESPRAPARVVSPTPSRFFFASRLTHFTGSVAHGR